eukprot:256622-Rhodomonas_salina.1
MLSAYPISLYLSYQPMLSAYKYSAISRRVLRYLPTLRYQPTRTQLSAYDVSLRALCYQLTGTPLLAYAHAASS